jgi:hypothetical protein
MEIDGQHMNRCSVRMPCPLCGKKKFCMVSDDGKIIICTKIESKRLLKQGFGWIHSTDNLPPAKQRFQVVKSTYHEPDPSAMIKIYNHLNFAEFKLKKLAKKWKISTQALMSLGVGYEYDQKFKVDKWYFPMRDEMKKLIGVQSRTLSAHSFCKPGSKMGVYIPNTLDISKPVAVFEGFSDTAVAQDLGINCLGRASSGTGKEIVTRLLKNCPKTLVVGDNDTKESHYAGQNGACDLSKLLQNSKWWVPKKQNDFKDFVHAGAFNPKQFINFLRKDVWNVENLTRKT